MLGESSGGVRGGRRAVFHVGLTTQGFFFFFFSNTSFLGSALWKMAPGAETPKLHLEKAQGTDNLGLGTWLWELSQGLSQCWGLGH